MKIIKIPLRPYTRAHFGELKIDHDLALTDTAEYAHSDTLFSALVHAHARHTQKEDAEDFVNYFKQDKIKISSLFYYLTNGGETVYFLPKPVHLSIYDAKDGQHKIRNKIAYVSHGVWRKGLESAKWLTGDEYVLIDKKMVMTQAEFEALGLEESDKNRLKIFSIVTTPKSPQRADDNAAIYYQADIQIAAKPTHTGTGAKDDFEIGWYYIYEAEGQAETDLHIATNIMAYTGIGGEITNTGRTPEKDPEAITIDDLPDAAQYCNASLLCPADAAEFAQVEYYQTTLRGGRRISNEEAVRVVRMIRECALIQTNDIKGQIPRLGTDNNGRDILRLGKPLLIPCKTPY